MLCYANASLPTHKMLRWMNCDSRVRSPEETDAGNHHTNLRKQYISNHFSMLGKDNRSSDRAIDCHLNNGMLDKVSLSLSLTKEKVTQWHKSACNHLFGASNCQQEAPLWLRSSRSCFLSTTATDRQLQIADVWQKKKKKVFKSSLLCTQVDIWKNLTLIIKRDGEGKKTTLNILI